MTCPAASGVEDSLLLCDQCPGKNTHALEASFGYLAKGMLKYALLVTIWSPPGAYTKIHEQLRLRAEYFRPVELEIRGRPGRMSMDLL